MLSTSPSGPTAAGLGMLNEALAPVPLALTTFVFVCIGTILFLLPPVPGVPVYLCGGVVLVRCCEREWASEESIEAYRNGTLVGIMGTALSPAWVEGLVYTCGTCMFLKMRAAWLPYYHATFKS